jgi:AcrR family transcriptional regulator
VSAAVDPVKRSRANTRARLLDAAFEVFAERGFDRASVEDVCEAAGFTRGAFYSNFASKEELFFALWQGRADAIVATVASRLDDLTDDPARFEEALADVVRRVTDDRRWFLVNTEFLLHAIRNPSAATSLAEHRRLLRAGLVDVLARVLPVRGATLPPGLDLDRFARLLIAGIEGTQHQVWTEPEVLAEGTLPEAMVRRLLG